MFNFHRRLFIWLLFRKKKIFFLHIGKAAGSSIASQISADFKGESSERYINHVFRFFWLKYIVYVPHHNVPKYFASRTNLFIIIRDPIDRLESAFRYLKHPNFSIYGTPVEKRIGVVFEGFNDFCDALRDENHSEHNLAIRSLMSNGYHHFWMDYRYYFGSREAVIKAKDRIVFVGESENFEYNIRALNWLAGSNLSSHIHINRAPISSHKQKLSTKNRDFLEQFLNEEYCIYNALLDISNEKKIKVV